MSPSISIAVSSCDRATAVAVTTTPWCSSLTDIAFAGIPAGSTTAIGTFTVHSPAGPPKASSTLRTPDSSRTSLRCQSRISETSVRRWGVCLGGAPIDPRRGPRAAADAERREAVALLALAQLVRGREREPCARRAERMAERDRAAVHVRLLAIEAEVLLDGEVLRRKRLVDLDEVH